MASFAVSAFDAGSAAAAGAVNFTTLANGGSSHIHAAVSTTFLTGVAITGNIVSGLALLIPIYTFVIPVCKGKGLIQRTMYSILFVLFGSVVWALFALPSMPGSKLVLSLNCIGIGIQTGYAMFFICRAAGKKRKMSIIMCLAVAVVSAVMVAMVVFLIVRTHKWSTKVIGIIAATFATLTFLAGLTDIWVIFKTGESGMSKLQIIANACSAFVWGFYGFLFRPVNWYIVVPNTTGVATSILQLICHTIHTCQKQRNAGARNAGAAPGNGVRATV